MLDEIREKFRTRRYEFSRHALDQSIQRSIGVAQIEAAVLGDAEVIEDYPDDKYGPSCLILGFTETGRPLHLVTSYPNRPLVKIITVYEPHPSEWTDYRVRRKSR